MPRASSDLITPELPTLPIASAMRFADRRLALAEMVPTWAISCAVAQGRDVAFSRPTMRSTAGPIRA